MRDSASNSIGDKVLLITKCMVNVMFWCGVPMTISIPWVFKWYGAIDSFFETNYVRESILYMISGLFACLIVYELRKMIRSVELDDCFIWGNVVSLKRMAIYAFAIALVTIVRIITHWTPAVVIILIVFAIAGMFSEVLASVFAKAVEYKEENDMTI